MLNVCFQEGGGERGSEREEEQRQHKRRRELQTKSKTHFDGRRRMVLHRVPSRVSVLLAETRGGGGRSISSREFARPLFCALCCKRKRMMVARSFLMWVWSSGLRAVDRHI